MFFSLTYINNMKIRYLFILLVCVFIFAISINADSKKTIIIDPGHGGIDPGTIYGDIYEKDLNLAISLKLANKLKKDYNVLLIRDGDYDLSKPNAVYRKKSDFDNRINLINNSHANLYISIHMNYLVDTAYSGPQVFYDQNNKDIAMVMQDILNDELNGSRQIKKIPSSTYMYKHIEVPGILIECGFLSNEKERNLLVNADYQDKISNAIKKGITKIQSI